jgi:Tol biopolymer transport system component
MSKATSRSSSILIACCCAAIARAAAFSWDAEAQLWLPDVVSTAQSEVRITFTPDGERMLWGAIDWPKGAGGWDIYESVRTADGWTPPKSVAFNSAANDFDPSFAPDGSGVYFFSNRAGGFGKDDIYFAAFDREGGRYGRAVNLGDTINTSGEEWAPVVSSDGIRLMFASDGHGGKGKHDLFIAQRIGERWGNVTNLAALNSAEEDFDAAFLHDGQSIVFSRGTFDGLVHLFLAEFRAGAWHSPVRLSDAINSIEPDAWTFGPSISPHDPDALYFTSRHARHRGRADIYRIRYKGSP